MKTIIRLPTEQFAYIEQELEGTAEEAVAAFHELKRAWAGEKAGLTKKEFDSFLDIYLTTETGSTEVYARMSPEQTQCVQTIKRSFARIKSKQENGN